MIRALPSKEANDALQEDDRGGGFDSRNGSLS